MNEKLYKYCFLNALPISGRTSIFVNNVLKEFNEPYQEISTVRFIEEIISLNSSFKMNYCFNNDQIEYINYILDSFKNYKKIIIAYNVIRGSFPSHLKFFFEVNKQNFLMGINFFIIKLAGGSLTGSINSLADLILANGGSVSSFFHFTNFLSADQSKLDLKQDFLLNQLKSFLN